MSQVQEKASVGAKEFIAMLTLFVATDAFLNYPQYVAKASLNAGWMDPLISGVLTLVLFLVVEVILRKRFPGLDVVEVCKERFGSFLAVIVAVIFAVYFLAATANVMRQFTENVALTVLPTTPFLLIITLFIVAVGYVAFCGLEGVARLAYMGLPILVVGTTVLCLMTSNWWNPRFLTPFWGAGINSVLWGGARYASIFTNVLLLCIIYPHAHDPKALRKVGVVSIVLASVLLSGFIATYLMVFPTTEATKVSFPMYQVARLIHIGRFIQRFESIFIFLWVASAVIKMSITLWAAAYLMASAFSWPTYRPALPALALLCFAASIWPKNFVDVIQFDEAVLLGWGWTVVFALPVLIAVVAAFLKPRRRRPGRA